MRGNPINHRDDSNIRIAGYESLLDLFTLLSFMLMFAAFIYMAQSAAGSQNLNHVVAEVAVHGSGPSRALPRNVVLIVLSREQSVDKIEMVEAGIKTPQVFDVTPTNLDSVLSRFISSFGRVSTINIGLYNGQEDANPIIYVAIQRWLSGHGYHNYKVYFAGKWS